MNKETFAQSYLPKIESCLSQLLTSPNGSENRLYEAARYMTLKSGKRLRPLLVLATVQAFDGPLELSLYPACALELLHTYSLIHDDLPCMDNDDFRRGKPTLHKQFDEATAVLTGDFLLTYPFQILAESPGLSDGQKLGLIQTLAIRAGGDGMIAGQMLDLEAQEKPITLDALKIVHRKKTGDLLTASLLFGGIIAKLPPSQMEVLKLIGHEVGLAFQIIDDVIDRTSSVKKHGKAESSDTINGKTTYVSCLGIEGAQIAADQLLTGSLTRLESFPNSAILKAIVSSLVCRKE